jgi:hypothetical protein
VRISLDSKKPAGVWASFNEPLIGAVDGVNKEFETPFPAREARSLHVMREYVIIAPDAVNRVLDVDGHVLHDDPDGYRATSADPDQPVKITTDRPPRLGQRMSCSVLGRKPPQENATTTGKAFKVLPLTDNVAASLDKELPESLRKRSRREETTLGGLQKLYCETFMQVVVDFHGFTGDDDQPLACTDPAKRAILRELPSTVLGPFVRDRALAYQNERTSGMRSDGSD